MSTVHTTTAKRRGAPPAGQRLTRETVLASAAELIERDGLAAFSLRALAAHLEVRPSALYNHVESLDDLLTALAARAVAQFELNEGPGAWDDWLRTVGAEMRAWLLERPQTAGLILERAGATAGGPDLLNRITDRLSAAGVDRTVAHMAWHVVFTVVVGTVQQDLSRRIATDGTFEAVLSIAVDGLAATATTSPPPAMRRLVRSHGFSDR